MVSARIAYSRSICVQYADEIGSVSGNTEEHTVYNSLEEEIATLVD